ncbi:hypothetical protein LTR62_001796 [Meristemomyces frigidus]|uniref:CREG-like beta-barrel domain-containing protein n=1 Tax=Meristemomyces frigidus TaxID=1508187 RepID=A0AAN7YSI5_9PEZI|nr:hypothetical protein LTR62_001796 [Meristemomyces frigidus]
MRITSTIVTLAGTVTARTVLPDNIDQIPVHNADLKMPTIHESTVMARRIMHLSSIGTLTTTFPDQPKAIDSSGSSWEHSELNAFENRPEEMAGNPISLMEYYSDCEPTTGNPTLLAINIATPYKNFAAGSNISLAIRWWPIQTNTYAASSSDVYWEADEDIPTPHTPAALPRFSLHGYLEPISIKDLATGLIPACFLRAHPDSMLWQPGNDIHTSQYVRFVVEHVYWFGGFGDRARIGWLPIEEWRNVTMDEVMAARLPGEHKRRSGGHSDYVQERRKKVSWSSWLGDLMSSPALVARFRGDW